MQISRGDYGHFQNFIDHVFRRRSGFIKILSSAVIPKFGTHLPKKSLIYASVNALGLFYLRKIKIQEVQ